MCKYTEALAAPCRYWDFVRYSHAKCGTVQSTRPCYIVTKVRLYPPRTLKEIKIEAIILNSCLGSAHLFEAIVPNLK